MAVSVVATSCLVGIESKLILVEVNISSGLPRFDVVGLPDNSIKESRIRAISAIELSVGKLPIRKISINLSPANLYKTGTGFDLPISLALLEAAKLIPPNKLDDYLIIGELSLKGEVKTVRGVLAASELAQKLGYKGIICPKLNVEEASLIPGINIYVAESISQIVDILKNNKPFVAVKARNILNNEPSYLDISDVKGQEKGKRALQIAAAGGHHTLFIGPPGTGKSMLASRLAGILPPLTIDQSLEVAKIYLSYEQQQKEESFNSFGQRQFRSPHHSTSNVGLIGGGSHPKPGEISLAHHGALFLDEFTEFTASSLNMLRQPMENYYVIISRSKYSVKFPCQFQLIAAMNPCPCGYYGDYSNNCTCSPTQIKRYLNKISGPILDRIDLQVEFSKLNYNKLNENKITETSKSIKEKVIIAINNQLARYKNDHNKRNCLLSHKELQIYAPLDKAGKSFMEKAMNHWNLSNRAHDRIIKIARTIADLESSKNITEIHLMEALNFRYFDKKNKYFA